MRTELDHARADSSVSASPRGIRARLSGIAPYLAKYGVILSMVATFAAFSAAEPESFFTVLTLKAILRDAAPLLIVALGATVVLVMNEFDLSIGGALGFAGTIAVMLVSDAHAGLPVVLGLIIALAFGAALGLVNGVLVSYAGASSFIVTIAMGTLYQGADLRVLNQRTIFEGIPDAYTSIASGRILGLSNQVFVALAVLVAVYVFLEHTEIGRYMYAIGGNAEAARLAGIRVRGLRALGFAIVGVCTAAGAILVSAQAGAANPNSGLGFLLPAYAAAFLGSTMWRPGVFTAIGTLLGALFLQIIGTGLTILNLTGPVVLMTQGGILVAAILLSRVGRT
jgi:ribose transport system permease protein